MTGTIRRLGSVTTVLAAITALVASESLLFFGASRSTRTGQWSSGLRYLLGTGDYNAYLSFVFSVGFFLLAAALAYAVRTRNDAIVAGLLVVVAGFVYVGRMSVGAFALPTLLFLVLSALLLALDAGRRRLIGGGAGGG